MKNLSKTKKETVEWSVKISNKSTSINFLIEVDLKPKKRWWKIFKKDDTKNAKRAIRRLLESYQDSDF